MRNKFLLVAVFIMNMRAVYSQNVQQDVQNIWKEKTEWLQNAAVRNGHMATNNNEKSTNDSNIVVSATADIQSEVHAAIDPNDSNNIVVSSNYVGSSLIPSSINYLYYSNNFGNTWNKSSFAAGPDGTNSFVLGGGDPNFAYTDAGKVYFSWINLFYDQSFNSYFNLYWASSTDGGNNWTRDSTNDLIGSTSASGAFDKEWLALDKNPASQYYGNLYCCFLYADANSGNEYIGVRHKTASGTFDTVSAIVSSGHYKFVQFSSVAVDYNGGVHATFFASIDSVTYSLYHALSTNGGATFQPETKISDVYLEHYSAGQQNDSIEGVLLSRMYPSAYIACDNTGGAFNNHLYMVWTANGITSKLNSGNDVYLSISTNGGSTWSSPRILNDNTTNLTSDQYYPDITVSPNGRVAIIWWDRRNDTANLKSDIYMTYSDNGGQTFAPDMKVTSQFTDFSTVGLLNGGFGMGEYNCVLATKDYIIPVWADGRSNTGQMNLYSAFIHVTPGQALGIQSITAINGPLKITSVYPNPAKDLLTLTYESSEAGKMNLSVYDARGKLVQPLDDIQITTGKGTLPLNINSLASGTYLLKVVLNGTLNVREFVKVR